jgi:hypothetical protein
VATTKLNESSIKTEQPNKYEGMKRIEREKRAQQKKHMDEEYDRHIHPMKQKKTAKTNWTKQYEKGSLDWEEF